MPSKPFDPAKPLNVTNQVSLLVKKMAAGQPPRVAGRAVGYNDNFLKTRIYALINHPDFIRMLEEEKKSFGTTRAEGEVTTQEIIDKLRRAYEEAMLAGKYADAARCAELLGKHIRMFEGTSSGQIFNPASKEDRERFGKIANMESGKSGSTKKETVN